MWTLVRLAPPARPPRAALLQRLAQSIDAAICGTARDGGALLDPNTRQVALQTLARVVNIYDQQASSLISLHLEDPDENVQLSAKEAFEHVAGTDAFIALLTARLEPSRRAASP